VGRAFRHALERERLRRVVRVAAPGRQGGLANENAQAGTPDQQRRHRAGRFPPYEAMDHEFGIKDLRWGLQHAAFATPDHLARLKALNCAVSMSGFNLAERCAARRWSAQWAASTRRSSRAESKAGLHEDGVHIAPHNPWFAMHYATTGLNVLGQQINPGQQITRQQALHAYTRGQCVVPQPRERPRLDRGGQARRSGGAGPRLFQRQRR